MIYDTVLRRKAMCSVNDTKLGASTIEYMSTKARDQDVMQFVWGLIKNPRMKRQYIKYFKENYDAVSTTPASESLFGF